MSPRRGQRLRLQELGLFKQGEIFLSTLDKNAGFCYDFSC